MHYSGAWPGQKIGVIDGTNGLVTAGLQQRMNRYGELHHFQLMRTAKLEYMGYTADQREIIRIWNLPEVKKDAFATAILAEVELDGVVAVHDKFSPLDCLRLMWDNLKPGGVFTLFCIFLEVSDNHNLASDGSEADLGSKAISNYDSRGIIIYAEVSGRGQTDTPDDEDASQFGVCVTREQGEVKGQNMML